MNKSKPIVPEVSKHQKQQIKPTTSSNKQIKKRKTNKPQPAFLTCVPAPRENYLINKKVLNLLQAG